MNSFFLHPADPLSQHIICSSGTHSTAHTNTAVQGICQYISLPELVLYSSKSLQKKSREMPLHLLYRNPDFNMRLIKEWFIYLDHQQLKVHTPNQDTEFLWMESRLISVNTSSTPGSWRDQAISWTWLGPGLYQINFYFLLSSTASVQVAITTHHCKDGQIQLLPDFRGREET